MLLIGVAPSLPALDLTVAVHPNPVVVGGTVRIDITFAYPDASEVSTDPLTLPTALSVVSGPDVRPYVDPSHPEVAEVRVSFQLEVDAAGRFGVPSIVVHAGSQTAATSPFLLAAGVDRGGGIVIPLIARWRPLLTPLYAGETVPFALEVENEPSPLAVDSITFAPPPGAFLPAGNLLAPQTAEVGGTTLYTIPAALYEYTLPAAGTVTLPGASLRAGERRGTADALALEVLPTPSAIASSGAIGSLSYSATLEATGRPDAVGLRLRVEGEGNLGYLRLPEPELDNVVTVGDEERKSLEPTLRGEGGYRERIYRFLAAGEGAASVRVPGFSWFDPFTGELHHAPGRVIRLSRFASAQPGGSPSGEEPATVGSGTGSPGAEAVTASPPKGEGGPHGGVGGGAAQSPERGGAAARPSPESATGRLPAVGAAEAVLPFGPQPWSVIERSDFREHAADPLDYLWLLPGPLLLVVVLVARRRPGGAAALLLLVAFLLGSTPPRSEKLEPVATKALADYAAGRLEEALSGFAAGLAIEPRNAALFFNQSLAEYRLGLSGYAVGSVRSAIYWDPTSRHYRSLLRWMIGRLSIPEQVAPVAPLDPNLFFLGFVLFFNGAGVAVSLFLLQRKAGWVILLGLCAVLAVGSAGGLLYTLAARSVRTAVVAEPHTELRKIPVDSASHWLDLSQGTAVRVLGEAGAYDLIETGYGIKGWVKRGGLLLDGLRNPPKGAG